MKKIMIATLLISIATLLISIATMGLASSDKNMCSLLSLSSDHAWEGAAYTSDNCFFAGAMGFNK